MSSSPANREEKKEIPHAVKAPSATVNPGNAALRGEIEAGLTKIADCGQRINDNMPASGQPFKDPGYIAKQIAFLIDAAQGMQRSLEAHHRPGKAPMLEKPKES